MTLQLTYRMISSFVLILFLLSSLGCSRPGQATKEEQQPLKTYKVTAADIQTYVEATGSVQPDIAGTA
jgi:multidrug efflux pump subunit AcrA (membrane-fusion protein)